MTDLVQSRGPQNQAPQNQAPQTIGPPSARERAAWAFYDFANSGYTTVVLTTIYSAYFVAVVAAPVEAKYAGSATLLWTLSLALANLVVLIGGPVIGAIADHRASKKRFLLMSSVLCVISTAGLALVAPGMVFLAVGLLIVSAIAFAVGENLIAAFLPEIAGKDDMGRISGYGWSLGYFGGLLTLGTCLAYISWAEGNGATARDFVPVCLMITAVVFAITSAPTFLWLRERAIPSAVQVSGSYIQTGIQQVLETLRRAAQLPDLFRFLWCLTLFQAGVATVIVVAAIYAQEVMGFDSVQLITLIMVVNFTAALGAFAVGYAQDKWGSVRSLLFALSIWILAVVVTLTANSTADVWIAGNLMGLAMGATQAGGRALIGQLTPDARSAEIFGLWGLANRAAAIIGPLSYGLITGLSGGNYRLAMVSTLLFFIAGMGLLFTVNEARGKEAAQQASTA